MGNPPCHQAGLRPGGREGLVADEGSPELWAYLERGMDAHFAQLALEAAKAMGQYSAQLAAGAMSAMHVSASVSGSGSQSNSYSNSDSRSKSESKSESHNYNY